MEQTAPGILSAKELADMAKTRGFLSKLLNVHFMTRPEQEFVAQLRSEEFSSALKEIAAPEMFNTEVAAGASLMLEYLQSTSTIEAFRFAEILGVDRTRLFGGLRPGLGPPPPYESVWNTDSNDATDMLRRLSKIYREAGLALSSQVNQRPDYIGVELDYLGQLSLREAKAWEMNNEKFAIECLDQQVRFISQHFGVWVPLFIEQALPAARTDFYRGHLLMLSGYVAELVELTSD